jgi:hypothetical protein
VEGIVCSFRALLPADPSRLRLVVVQEILCLRSIVVSATKYVLTVITVIISTSSSGSGRTND